MPTTLTAAEKRLRDAEQAVADAKAEVERLKALPAEPAIGKVIRYRMKFAGTSTVYTYAAIHATDGSWYTTAQRENRVYTWPQLVEHIQHRNVLRSNIIEVLG